MSFYATLFMSKLTQGMPLQPNYMESRKENGTKYQVIRCLIPIYAIKSRRYQTKNISSLQPDLQQQQQEAHGMYTLRSR